MTTWQKESQAVGRVIKSQVHFDFSNETLQALKIVAAQQNISPSDMIRKILGLEAISRPLRPRVGVSFSDEERAAITEGLGMEFSENVDFKQHCQRKINNYLTNNNK